MLQCEIEFASPYPEDAAPVPTDSEARVKSETAIYQPYHDIEILAKPSKSHGRTAKNIRVIRGDSKCSSGEIETYEPVFVPVIGPAVVVQLIVVMRRGSKRGTIVRILLDRSCEQVECESDALLLP